MKKIMSAAQAVASIQDGQTVASVGVIGWVVPDATLEALGTRFRETGAPRSRCSMFAHREQR